MSKEKKELMNKITRGTDIKFFNEEIKRYTRDKQKGY